MQTLSQSGYRQFYLAFGDSNFRTTDWTTAAKDLTGPLRELVRLFLLQQPVKRRRVEEILGPDAVRQLGDCGVLLDQNGELASNSFYLIVSRSFNLLCQMNAQPWAYFGEDSLALAMMQTPACGGRVLDLCCGPGIQSFVASTHARDVTGVEIKPETWRIAELNRGLNGLSDRVRFVRSSAEDFSRQDSRQYDLILFNPPLVPTVPGYQYAFVGDGGADGLAVTRRIVELYHDRLTKQGRLEFIGMGLGRKDDPLVSRDLAKLARKYGLGGRIHLMSQHPIKEHSPMFEAYAQTFAWENKLSLPAGRRVLAEHFRKCGYDYFWLFFVSLQPPAGRRQNSITEIDLTKTFWGGWFV